VARLVYGSLVLLAPHKKVGWIDLADIQDRMYCHFDCTSAIMTLITQQQESAGCLLNSAMPRTASGHPVMHPVMSGDVRLKVRDARLYVNEDIGHRIELGPGIPQFFFFLRPSLRLLTLIDSISYCMSEGKETGRSAVAPESSVRSYCASGLKVGARKHFSPCFCFCRTSASKLLFPIQVPG
jgi:hypothetical protein